ncbi:Amiloride-sensitive sodium channel subunit alpha [Araneus ventricosus]|uniref:Amiloride-sensitive sodium channel subunit alpha n=1 Tax=Araneus ventricosus TaxID=182803 RepID=A0A4Y2I197_ARAVE|nr:Amiloride-sensitive sodium channel subunit alpha [Araneus ventricosus]
MKELKIPGGKLILVKGQPQLVLSERRTVQQSRKPEQGEPNPTVKFLNKYYKMSEAERFRGGHYPTDFVKKCLFNGRHCSKLNLHNYTSFRFGNYVAFNKRISSSKLLRTTKTGVGTGLIIDLNLEIDYYLSLTHTIGAKVVIHGPSDVLNLEEEGFILSPGYETLISLKQTVVQRLPAPYKDQCFDYKNQVNPAMTSKNMCVRECIQEKNFAKCGCIDLTLVAVNDLRPCDVMNETEVHCLNDVLANMSRIGSNCKCPLPCTSVFHNEIISKAYTIPKVLCL